jgi:hypothetical protein
LIIQIEAEISERGRFSIPRQLLTGQQEIVCLSSRESRLEVASITGSQPITETSEIVNAIETECVVVGTEEMDGDSGSKRTLGYRCGCGFHIEVNLDAARKRGGNMAAECISEPTTDCFRRSRCR